MGDKGACKGRGTLSDIGLGAVSGVAKGVTSVSNAASRLVEGDEVADKRMQQANEAFTPLNQGTAGHIASGITEVVFDRGGFIYQGKIQAFADAAREAGLVF